MTPITQPGTHLISSNSRETTKCININGGLIEVILVPRRAFQPLKRLMCDSVRGRDPQPGFAISCVTRETMTTVSHNSSEDVTFLTDEKALWAACVSVIGLVILVRTDQSGHVSLSSQQYNRFFSFFYMKIHTYVKESTRVRRAHVHVKVKVKIQHDNECRCFLYNVKPNLEPLPLEDQLSSLI